MSRPKQKWDEINIRRMERYGKIGLEIESKIANFLQEVKDNEGNPIFERVIHHEQFSTDDLRGRDISVYLRKNGTLFKRSFGVTTSLRRFHQKNGLHKAPLFFTPVDYNPEHLLQKILSLFE
ncbi:MAG: hypothetical protein JW740_00765 [Candidatus Zambryskibacteria bacterium]|nr:hypothetical protein [Candidatus Zambryskibacteria bacterium]